MAGSTRPESYRWNQERYQALAETDVLRGEHVELIGGQIVEMGKESPEHAAVSSMVMQTLFASVTNAPTETSHLRVRSPIGLSNWDVPQPDVVIISGRSRDYLHIDRYPSAAETLLVVEVSYSSRVYDLGTKADIYAAARIADYWVVIPDERVVVVFRQPAPSPASETDWRYAERQTYTSGQTIAPVAASLRPVAVADLLPRQRGGAATQRA